MIFTLCLKVDLVRFFRGFVSSEVRRNFIDPNVRLPVVAVASNAQQARRGPFLLPASILRVFKGAAKSQVSDAIVGSVSIDMVDRAIRHSPVNVKPRYAVQSIAFPLRERSQIASVVSTSRNVSNFYALRYFLTPSKNTGVWVVIQHVANVLGGKIEIHGFAFTYVLHRRSIA